MKKKLNIDGHNFTIKTWNYGEKQRALKKATKWVKRKVTDDELYPEVDPWTLNDQMLVTCIEKWDLKNDKDKPLKITVENIHGIEPPELVEQLLTEIQKINGVSESEEKKS